MTFRYGTTHPEQNGAIDLLVQARTLQKQHSDIGMPISLPDALGLVEKRDHGGKPDQPLAASGTPPLGMSSRAVEIAVTAAIDSGRVLDEHRHWATGFCNRDPDGFQAFLASAPVLNGQASEKDTGTAEIDDPARRAREIAEAAKKLQDEQIAAGRPISFLDAVGIVEQRKEFAR